MDVHCTADGIQLPRDSEPIQEKIIRGQSMSYKVGSLIGQGITSIGRSKSKLEEEQNYYACIIDIFDEIVS